MMKIVKTDNCGGTTEAHFDDVTDAAQILSVMFGVTLPDAVQRQQHHNAMNAALRSQYTNRPTTDPATIFDHLHGSH